jgi:hypothetical protein
MVLCACSGAINPASTDAAAGADGHPTQDTVETAEQWRDLIMVDWSVAPGTERFVCALATIPEELFIQRFEPVAPSGTHHVLLTLVGPGGTDGVFDCSPGTLSDAMLFAAGIDSEGQDLPLGVAMRIPAGSQVLINIHLLNPLLTEVSGTSGIRVGVAPAVAVAQQAEMIFAGTTRFTIEPGTQESATGRCEFAKDATVLLVWPHMHTLGVHMRVVHVAGDPLAATTPRVILHDAPYDFGEQRQYPIDPTLVRAGESIEVTCTWDNPGNQVVVFGDSTLEEMCFAGLVRYPANHQGLYCHDTR